MNYVLVLADKVTNNVVVVLQLYHINTLYVSFLTLTPINCSLLLSGRVVVDEHGCHTVLHFGVKAKENQEIVSTLYWLPKLHNSL